MPEKQVHRWLKSIRVTIEPRATSDRLLQDAVRKLRRRFARNGHVLTETPSNETDIVISTGEFGQPIAVEDSPALSLWRNYRLNSPPSVVMLVHLRTDEFVNAVTHLQALLSNPNTCPGDYSYAGLSSEAHKILREQGRRGGALLALARILQGQLKCVRIALLVGDNAPSRAYHFDLVGSTACTTLHMDEAAFYDDIVNRIVTTVSTRQVTDHLPSDLTVSDSTWTGLESVAAMCRAGQELNDRRFFTEAVSVSDLITAPTVSESIAKQYSEGCYATWDASFNALIATITGAAKVLNKGEITKHDLVPIDELNNTRSGVVYRRIDGRLDYPPSSEAFEMLLIDQSLPTIACPLTEHEGVRVPVIRSKLHGHRGIKSYDPRRAEYAPVEDAYFNYPVTCGSEAQAAALTEALSKSQALRHATDPRAVVFTVLPCHGVLIVEKWLPQKRPFQVIWECMDQGAIQIADSVPQELARYEMQPDGHFALGGTANNHNDEFLESYRRRLADSEGDSLRFQTPHPRQRLECPTAEEPT